MMIDFGTFEAGKLLLGSHSPIVVRVPMVHIPSCKARPTFCYSFADPRITSISLVIATIGWHSIAVLWMAREKVIGKRSGRVLVACGPCIGDARLKRNVRMARSTEEVDA